MRFFHLSVSKFALILDLWRTDFCKIKLFDGFAIMINGKTITRILKLFQVSECPRDTVNLKNALNVKLVAIGCVRAGISPTLQLRIFS